MRLSTEHTGLMKSFLAVWVLPPSSVCPPSLLVGFLRQTDNRAPAGLPVHLTGHDSLHAGLVHTLSVPCLIYFWLLFFFLRVPPTHLTLCLPLSLSTELSYSMRLQEEPALGCSCTVSLVHLTFWRSPLSMTSSVGCLACFPRMHFNKPPDKGCKHAFRLAQHMGILI